jgi:hypothetical protein
VPIPQTDDWPPDSSAIDVDDHLTLDVVTVTGRAAAVDLQVHRNDVEIWHHLQRAAVVDRELLRGWLTQPDRCLMVGDVLFNLDRRVDVRDRSAISLDLAPERITISLSDVRSWPLSAGQLETLRHLV